MLMSVVLRLVTLALMAIDWTTVKIPERLQKKLLGGLPTGDECGQVVREIFHEDSSEASSTTCEALVEKAHDFNRKPVERVGIGRPDLRMSPIDRTHCS